MQAVLLAAGKGTRLRPYTFVLPKPLMPVGELPIAEIIVRQLKYHGFSEIVISTGHLAPLMEAYFGDGSRWGVTIRYFREEEPLGTAGALGLIDDLQDDFLVINGDTLTTLDYRQLFQQHLRNGGLATIGVHTREVKIDFGVIEMTVERELAGYIEKPTHSSLVSMGVNMLSVKCQQYIGKNESLGMPDLLLRMKADGQKVYCHRTDAYWLDIGRLDDYQIAQDEFERNRKLFLPDET
jgi:NDP-sugar pyrophosphorylase family protein